MVVHSRRSPGPNTTNQPTSKPAQGYCGLPPAPDKDHGLIRPLDSTDPLAASTAFRDFPSQHCGQSTNVDRLPSPILNISEDEAIQLESFFDFDAYLRRDITLAVESPKVKDELSGEGSTHSFCAGQTVDQLEASSSGFGLHSEATISRKETASSVSQAQDLKIAAHVDEYAEGRIQGQFEDHPTQPSTPENSVMGSVPDAFMEPSVVGDSFGSSFFHQHHSSSCFSPFHEQANILPDGSPGIESDEVSWHPIPLAYQTMVPVQNMAASKLDSDTCAAANMAYPSSDMVTGTDSDISTALERLCEDLRSRQDIPTLEMVTLGTDMEPMNNIASTPAMTPSSSTPHSSFSDESPSNNEVRRRWCCGTCGLYFKQRCRLNRHRTTVHVRSHQCEHCQAEPFGLPKDLERHKRTKHPELSSSSRTYCCSHPGCRLFNKPKFRGRPDNYMKHMRTHHPNANSPNESGSSFTSSPSTS